MVFMKANYTGGNLYGIILMDKTKIVIFVLNEKGIKSLKCVRVKL